MSRGWITKATLLLDDVCGMTDEEIIAEIIDTGGKVSVVYDRVVCSGLLMMQGKDGTVIIQGDVATESGLPALVPPFACRTVNLLPLLV